MPNQIDSPDGQPRKEDGRPSPDVDRHATDGQSNAWGKGASDEQGQPQGGHSGRIDKAPGAGLSDRNGPSDPDAPRGPGSNAS